MLGRFLVRTARRVYPGRKLGDQAQRYVIGRSRDRGGRVSRDPDRAVALTDQPVLEIGRVQSNDAAHLEDRQWIAGSACHVPAPTLRATQGRSDSLPRFDEIGHAITSVAPSVCRGYAE